MFRAAAAAVLLTALMSGCTDSAEPPEAPGAAGDASAATPEPIAETFDIGGGRRMYLECRGTGSPTVVLVSGQRGSAEDWFITAADVDADAVFPRLAAHTRTCAYDRPGTPVGDGFSRSDPVPQPTTAAAMTSDLAALLEASAEPGPYVIVAHSAGGLAARLFAAEHPDDVAGLVLIDTLSPGLQDAQTAEQWRMQRIMLEGDLTASLAEYPDIERIDADASFEQLRAAGPLEPMPLTVISADRLWAPQWPELVAAGQVPAGIPADFGHVIDRAQQQSQAALAELVPDARHLTRTDSGHFVHQEQPQLVADAILAVVAEVRAS